MKFRPEDWDRWTERVNEIAADVSRLALDQQTFSYFRNLVLENDTWIDENHGFVFCEFVRRSYLSHVALGLRRQLPPKDKGSLSKVMHQVCQCSSSLSYQFYLGRFPAEPDTAPWQESAFAQFSKNGDVVSAELVETDIAQLAALGEKAKQLTNSSIAHLDPKKIRVRLTFLELESSVDCLTKLVGKYQVFLTGSSPKPLAPIIQSPWQRIFEVPWVQSKDG